MKIGDSVYVDGEEFVAAAAHHGDECRGCAGDVNERLCHALPACAGSPYWAWDGLPVDRHFIFVRPSQPPAKTVELPTGLAKHDGEADPTGKAANEPGAKLDAGKVRPALVIEGMARALWAVSEIATFGAAKYTDGGWVTVPNGETRYADAGYRHTLKRAMGEVKDPESEKLHLAHEAWNALAKLDLYLRKLEQLKT